MARDAISLPPKPFNEPVRDYAPGSPEREELQRRLRELESERIEIPMVIGGKDVTSGTTFEAVEPHRKSHVLADVHGAVLLVREDAGAELLARLGVGLEGHEGITGDLLHAQSGKP
jgi:1-pyrroline-5-carboxylate dehydrogenase